MTQSDLGRAIGVASQQIQKYEIGANRVSASRLWQISEKLGVPISFFFEGVNGAGAAPAPCIGTGALTDPDTLEVMRLFVGLPQNKKKAFASLLREIG